MRVGFEYDSYNMNNALTVYIIQAAWVQAGAVVAAVRIHTSSATDNPDHSPTTPDRTYTHNRLQ